SQNLVQLRRLLKLIDFRAAGELNWGSAVLSLTTTIMGSVLLSIFTSSSRPPVYIPTLNKDLWQAIFTLEREEASANSCRKRTTGPFKSKDNG
ncbi:hypothetical protein Golax_002310, partial [Gossypium laxum]|nr:hypothetical protein [Gossypium laxum]